jgi:hypothetical protein
LFQAGLNCLGLDQYQDIAFVPKIKERLTQQFGTLPKKVRSGDLEINIYDYPKAGPDANPHKRIDKRRLVFIAPINTSTKGTHASLGNHAGSGAPENDKAAGKRCAKPFRELSFRYDGWAAVCCNDWRGEMPVGNINKIVLEDIWHHERMYAMRRKLLRGQRDVGACSGCDHLSYRVGLLPDNTGKGVLPEPRPTDKKVIAEMLKAGPLAQPVKRPWENQ